MSRHPRQRRQGERPASGLTADVIVERAFQLVDELGADRFSMRLLARDLGVYPSAVAWHVGDRRCLCEMIDARWMRDVVPSPDGLTWIEWLQALAHAYRQAALAHPNVARLVASELANDAASFALPEAIVGQLGLGGLPAEELMHAYNAIVGATVGFVGMELGGEPLDESFAYLVDLLACGIERRTVSDRPADVTVGRG